MIDLPLHRFEEYGALSATEREAILALPDASYVVAKGECISRQDEVPTEFFLLLSGWAAASHLLSNGSRLISKIHLPGDALGTSSMAMRHRTEELLAITSVTVARVPFTRFGRLFETHPRIAARFMLSIQQERVALMDRLAGAGRTSSEARVAAFVLDLRDRLRPLGLVHDDGFEVPVTQEQIGDVLGLTAVHVNRVLRAFRANGLLDRDGRYFQIVDARRLDIVAARTIRVPSPDQSWLPAAR